MTTSVENACTHLRLALAALSARDPSEILRRKEMVRLVLTPLFDENSDEEDAVFLAKFDPSTGITQISSTEHPSRMNFRMHKLNRRRLERFVRKLELVNGYAEIEVEPSVYAIADRGNLYIFRESESSDGECWRMDPSSLIRSMEASADYNSI